MRVSVFLIKLESSSLHNMIRYILILLSFIFFSCHQDDNSEETPQDILQLQSIKVGTVALSIDGENNNIPRDKGIVTTFNLPLNRTSVTQHFSLKDGSGQPIELSFSYLDDDRTVSAKPASTLLNNTTYTIEIGVIKATSGEVFSGLTYTFTTAQGSFSLESIQIDDTDLKSSARMHNINRDFTITAAFSDPLQADTPFEEYVSVTNKNGSLPLHFGLSEDGKTLHVQPSDEAASLSKYTLRIANTLQSEDQDVFAGFEKQFYTAVDSTPKFPEISDEALLTLIQEQTFKYFWDFAHPASGMARERNTSGDLVTSGGSGFGLMTILVGIERNFITRQEGIDRIEKIVNFLETADRFHGAWSHWLNGNMGKAMPFSAKDDGADLVETAFVIQGLLTVKQYLNNADTQEAAIIATIDQLWQEVEWDWFTREGQNVLYWHWSPNHGWEMNHPIRGWDEGLITYVLAASSPTHGIDAQVYHEGWARNGGMANGKTFYDITLPLGQDYGGPLFFTHYPFLGLDPRNLEDQYGHYWEQNVNHALINYHYTVANPKNYVGYGPASWGLTASDDHEGYSAHSPTNDLGVITPTAAVASIPYTPEQSMEAIKHFYYIMGDKLWGEFGFYDAYNPTEDWYANTYLAIDQGPMIIMIENYRTGMLWDLFMANPEIQEGLEKLGFY